MIMLKRQLSNVRLIHAFFFVNLKNHIFAFHHIAKLAHACHDTKKLEH